MYPRQLEELAHQRTRQLQSAAESFHTTGKHAAQRRMRIEIGWVLVSVGLRIAESGSGGWADNEHTASV
jgi:hypothetical protein